MKLSNRIALTLALSTALFSVSALAQDANAGATAAPADSDTPAATHTGPAAKGTHHHKAMAQKTGNHVVYNACIKQKLAVAEYFCNAHSDSCKVEKDGAAMQCRSEARGERQKG